MSGIIKGRKNADNTVKYITLFIPGEDDIACMYDLATSNALQQLLIHVKIIFFIQLLLLYLHYVLFIINIMLVIHYILIILKNLDFFVNNKNK